MCSEHYAWRSPHCAIRPVPYGVDSRLSTLDSLSTSSKRAVGDRTPSLTPWSKPTDDDADERTDCVVYFPFHALLTSDCVAEPVVETAADFLPKDSNDTYSGRHQCLAVSSNPAICSSQGERMSEQHDHESLC